MTYNLKAMLKNETEKNDTVANYIANKMGYLDKSSISKFLNYEKYPNRECEKFTGLVAVVNEFFGDIAHEVMTDYAKTIKPTRETARYMLEYASSNNLRELQAYLIDKMMYSKNAEAVNWAKLYEIDYIYNERNLPNSKITVSNSEMINKIENFSSETEELQAFKKILQMYYYYENKHITILFETSEDAHHKIEKITNSADELYIKNSYLTRYASIMLGVYLSKDRKVECRELADQVIKSDAAINMKTIAYLQKGNSFIFENYDSAMESYKQGLDMTDKVNERLQLAIKRSINFLNVVWGEPLAFITDDSVISDLHNKIHDYLNKGKNEKAIEVLNSINFDQLDDCDKGFQMYYEGIAKNDKASLIESLKAFNKAGKRNYCNMTLIELEKHGENTSLLISLIA